MSEEHRGEKPPSLRDQQGFPDKGVSCWALRDEGTQLHICRVAFLAAERAPEGAWRGQQQAPMWKHSLVVQGGEGEGGAAAGRLVQVLGVGGPAQPGVPRPSSSQC